MRIGVSLPVRELQNDVGAIKAFAQAAEDLGLTHLRVPDLVIRQARPLHEPLTLLAMIAGVTARIELVPSVIVLPARPTALTAKQVSTLDLLSGGRVRLGVGLGKHEIEYRALGQDFKTRGDRVEEQIVLLRRLWTEENVNFEGRWDVIDNAGIAPLPVQRPIPIWIGANARPIQRIRERVGRLADGWFVLCTPEDYPEIKGDIDKAADAASRNPVTIGTEAGVAIVGPREHEWRDRVARWRDMGLTHLCLRTLGGELRPEEHIDRLREAMKDLPSI